MSGMRRPKATKLKETVESQRGSEFEMTKFLGKAANMAVVVSDPENLSTDPADVHLQETQAFTQQFSPEFSKTMPLPQLDDRTTPLGKPLAGPKSAAKSKTNDQVKAKKQSSAKWIDPNAVPQAIGTQVIKKPKPEPKSNFAPAMMFIGALGLVGYIVLAPGGGMKMTTASSKLTPQQLQERIEYHRKTTGWKLNNERISTQIDNHYQAPSLPYNAQKVKPQDMMKGLPLNMETNIGANAPDKTMPVNPSYADARVMYGLQEEQNNVEADKRANQLYVKEFIENAAADGYKITVDKEGNILEATKMKDPQSGFRLPAEQEPGD